MLKSKGKGCLKEFNSSKFKVDDYKVECFVKSESPNSIGMSITLTKIQWKDFLCFNPRIERYLEFNVNRILSKYNKYNITNTNIRDSFIHHNPAIRRNTSFLRINVNIFLKDKSQLTMDNPIVKLITSDIIELIENNKYIEPYNQ